MKLEDTGAIMITPLEFCHKVGIKQDNWIFAGSDLERSKFYMYKGIHNSSANEPERYFFNNGKIIREFKHMKEYGETWMRCYDMKASKPSWTVWTVWKVWND